MLYQQGGEQANKGENACVEDEAEEDKGGARKDKLFMWKQADGWIREDKSQTRTGSPTVQKDACFSVTDEAVAKKKKKEEKKWGMPTSRVIARTGNACAPNLLPA